MSQPSNIMLLKSVECLFAWLKEVLALKKKDKEKVPLTWWSQPLFSWHLWKLEHIKMAVEFWYPLSPHNGLILPAHSFKNYCFNQFTMLFDFQKFNSHIIQNSIWYIKYKCIHHKLLCEVSLTTINPGTQHNKLGTILLLFS